MGERRPGSMAFTGVTCPILGPACRGVADHGRCWSGRTGTFLVIGSGDESWLVGERQDWSTVIIVSEFP